MAIVDYKKIYEEEHINNPHIDRVLAFAVWRAKYNKFIYFESKLDKLANKNKFGEEYDRLDKISQDLARELGY